MLDFAAIDVEILHELAVRRSPRSFSDEPVPREDVLKLLEAARWAPSCFNEQPWRFMLAFKDGERLYQSIFESLVPDNARWAVSAEVLIVACVVRTRETNSQPNPTAEYDLGLAVSQLTVQATSIGLGVHQIAGFNPIRLARAVSLPSGVEPLVVLAIGYPADAATSLAPLRERAEKPRTRRPLRELVLAPVPVVLNAAQMVA